jgi:hypothetical protein
MKKNYMVFFNPPKHLKILQKAKPGRSLSTGFKHTSGGYRRKIEPFILRD